jgi:formylglycine-generating enzyme required for sulfatase activity
MVLLPGATFTMGSDDDEGEPGDGEAPARPVTLSPFWIDTLAVSNGRFAEFVAETGYVSEAESAGTSFVFAGLLPDDAPPTRAIADAPWWREVSGADWRHPEGPGSSLDQREDHPVVHVSWHDASAYCAWAGVRLPAEAEWEYAARGGLNGARFPWGDDLTPGGVHCCNIWQGRFPILNSGDDGYYGTAPVTTFEPNAFGLYNMSGNAWEWCADWFTPYHSHEHLNDPRGPGLGTHRVIRGGSYLCHESYCNRYRVSARSSNTPSSTTGNMGFRCARDA